MRGAANGGIADASNAPEGSSGRHGCDRELMLAATGYVWLAVWARVCAQVYILLGGNAFHDFSAT